MKVYVVNAVLDGELLGSIGVYTNRKKAEERLAKFKSDVVGNRHIFSEDVYPMTYAEITEEEVEG